MPTNTHTSSLTVQTQSLFLTKDGAKQIYRMPFCIYDGGRSESKRSRQNNDCTLRALAIVLDRPYDEIYEELKQAGRKCSGGFRLREYLENDPRFVWLPATNGEGMCSKSLAKFCVDHPNGTYIAQLAKHVVAVINGVVYDSFRNEPDRCVYGAWKVLS